MINDTKYFTGLSKMIKKALVIGDETALSYANLVGDKPIFDDVTGDLYVLDRTSGDVLAIIDGEQARKFFDGA